MSNTNEFPEPLGIEPSRRAFLRMAGFSLGAATLTGCTGGLETKAIPFLIQPEEITPGKGTWYATLCGACPAGCGALTKSRDGRPIKIEGNPQHPLSGGGVCAMGQASLLELYDSHRLDGPRAGGETSTWDVVDAKVSERFTGARTVRVLTGTINSPTQRAAIDRFCGRFRDGKHVMYDALSASALLDAHEHAFGRRVLPRLRFDRAQLILSFDADFLGTWISPVEYTRTYRAGRDVAGAFAKHIQIESRLSLTGCNADRRVVATPAELAGMLRELAAGKGEFAALLKNTPRGKSLIVCGVNDVELQRLVAHINHTHGNYENTLDLARPSHQRLGSDGQLRTLMGELERGVVDVLLVAGCNPAYDLPDVLALSKAKLVVSFAEREDESASFAHIQCPEPHWLETWSDAEPVAGTLTIGQPLVRPFRDTRPFVESLEVWSGGTRDVRAIMRDTWKPLAGRENFELFWTRALHDGFVQRDTPAAVPAYRGGIPAAPPAQPQGTTVVLYPKIGLGDGRHAHNAWLQELPDPVSKVVWDNYAALSPSKASQLDVGDGDVVRVGVGGASIDLPVRVQPGQHDDVVAIALGYGRKGTERFSNVGPDWIHAESTVEPDSTVGTNAAPLLAFGESSLGYVRAGATIEPTGATHRLAATQLFDFLTDPAGNHRPIVQQTTLDAVRADPKAGAPHGHAFDAQLWPDDHKYTGHHWGMAIDLTACTGCSACMIGCQAENNVPVVGKDEVARQREMHWLRIDRYYDGDEAVFQPMFCQQCDHAPCESVCPVLATVHSSEGLNQQVYNRCVGTRYCANNCPYKVRRFNWFDYPHEDQLQNLVLNPDVTVRMRGVMEKCTFCVQRIQEAKAEAKREGRAVRDGDVQPACVQSCPATAMVFGDMNDPQSKLRRWMDDGRAYSVLGELNTKPSVRYLRVVRDREEKRHD